MNLLSINLITINWFEIIDLLIKEIKCEYWSKYEIYHTWFSFLSRFSAYAFGEWRPCSPSTYHEVTASFFPCRASGRMYCRRFSFCPYLWALGVIGWSCCVPSSMLYLQYPLWPIYWWWANLSTTTCSSGVPTIAMCPIYPQTIWEYRLSTCSPYWFLS